MKATKNIVLCFDGTWNGPPILNKGRYPTNVYKLYRILKKDINKQIVAYFPGVGAEKSEQIRGGALGYGTSKRIISGYRFLVKHYNEGDSIFIFGFSRGAYIARSLCSFLMRPGLLLKGSNLSIKEKETDFFSQKAYSIYQNCDYMSKLKISQQLKDIVKPMKIESCEVKMLGIWDTVGSMGMPIRLFYKQDAGIFRNIIIGAFAIVMTLLHGLQGVNRFHDISLAPIVRSAYHALAIDEERQSFSPIFFDERGYELMYQTLKQVWFCGSHGDVGGGYEDHGLSDIPLAWMIQMGFRKGLLINSEELVNLNINQNVNGIIHDSREGFPGKLFKKKTRFYENNPTIHGSVLERKLNNKNSENPSYHPWVFDQNYDIEIWDKDIPIGQL